MEKVLPHVSPCPDCEEREPYDRELVQAYSDPTGTWRRVLIFDLCLECREYVQHRVNRDKVARIRAGQMS